MKRILNLLSLFFAVIGLCAMVLTCHIIFIYPNIDKSSPNGGNAIMARMDTATIDTSPTINIYQEESPLSVETFADQTSNTDLETDLQMPDAEQILPNHQDIPNEYQSALNKANDYCNAMYMSKAAIYDQLTSEYGECFSPEAAQYAIDNIVADWNSNALQKAIDYQNMNMSPEAIRDQLTSEYGERFTSEQANYAVANLSAEYSQENSSTLYSIPIEQSISSTNYIADNPVQNTVTQTNSEYNANITSESETQASIPIGNMVWLSETGSKYHNKNDCGNMNPNKARLVSLDEAVREGYEACSKCF